MFDSLTVYVMLGLLAGLTLSLFLFRKWDVPGYFRKRFRLGTRLKCMLFIVLFGVLLALCLAMLMDVLRLPPVAAQIIEGLSIGFNCAMIPTLMRPKDQSAGGGGGANARGKAQPDKKGRRSKG